MRYLHGMAYKYQKDNLAQQKRQRDRNLSNGICPRCVRPVVPGLKLCKVHRQYAKDQYSKTDKKKLLKWSKISADRLRDDAFDHYGKECACCGETLRQFLTIDHTNGDGAEQKKSGIFGGTSIYRWLRKNSYPEGFRILCFNCNAAMGIYGQCPHGNLPPQHTNHPANPFKLKT